MKFLNYLLCVIFFNIFSSLVLGEPTESPPPTEILFQSTGKCTAVCDCKDVGKPGVTTTCSADGYNVRCTQIGGSPCRGVECSDFDFSGTSSSRSFDCDPPK